MSFDRRTVRRTVGVAAFLAAFGAVAADKDWVLLRGQTLTQAFANQDFGDGVHFAYQFLEGGDMRGMNMGHPARGHWRVAGNALCWRWIKSKEPEECYTARRQGSAVRLFLDKQDVLSGNLTPLPVSPKEMTR